MRAALLSLLLCFWSVAASAGDLKIVGPPEVEPGRPAWFEITGVEEGTTATFFPSDVLQTGPPHIVTLHGMFWTETPGIYTINAIAATTTVDWEKKTVSTTLTPLSYRVEVGTPEPEPDPDPQPDPDPPPPDITDLTAVIVYETQDQDQQDPRWAQVMYGPTLAKLLGAKKWIVVDDDVEGDVPDYVAACIDKTKGENLKEPHLFLLDQNRKIVWNGHLPKSVDATVAIVKEYLP